MNPSMFQRGKKRPIVRRGAPSVDEFHQILQSMFGIVGVNPNDHYDDVANNGNEEIDAPKTSATRQQQSQTQPSSSASIKFTESAVLGFRSIYWMYLQQVAYHLVEHDSLSNEQQIIDALSLDASHNINSVVATATATTKTKKSKKTNNKIDDTNILMRSIEQAQALLAAKEQQKATLKQQHKQAAKANKKIEEQKANDDHDDNRIKSTADQKLPTTTTSATAVSDPLSQEVKVETTTNPTKRHKRRKIKRPKITADMEEEQNRLFAQSKESVLQNL